MQIDAGGGQHESYTIMSESKHNDSGYIVYEKHDTTECVQVVTTKGHQKCSIIKKRERKKTVGGGLHNHLCFVYFFVYIR